MKNVMVTGAAGFIGANFAEYFVNKHPDYNVIVVDKLTYAGNLANLDKVKDKITFVQADICDFEKMQEVFEKYQINGVIHFAAESHVDNSIKNPFIFTHTNAITNCSIKKPTLCATNHEKLVSSSASSTPFDLKNNETTRNTKLKIDVCKVSFLS